MGHTVQLIIEISVLLNFKKLQINIFIFIKNCII